MTIENPTPVSVETQSPPAEVTSVPEDEGTPPVEVPSDAPASEEVEEEAPEPIPWTPDVVKDDPHFQEWHESERATARREGADESAVEWDTHVQAAETRRDQALYAVQELNANLKEISDAGRGLDGTTFGRLLQRHAPGLALIPQILSEAALQPVADQAAAFTTAQAMYVIGEAMESEELKNMALRVAAPSNQVGADGQPIWNPTPEFRRNRGSEALKEFAKQLKKSLIADADKKGYERGVKMGRSGQVEATKAETRAGKGPATVTGNAGKGKPTYAQIVKMTPAQIKALPEGALMEAIDKEK